MINFKEIEQHAIDSKLKEDKALHEFNMAIFRKGPDLSRLRKLAQRAARLYVRDFNPHDYYSQSIRLV